MGTGVSVTGRRVEVGGTVGVDNCVGVGDSTAGWQAASKIRDPIRRICFIIHIKTQVPEALFQIIVLLQLLYAGHSITADVLQAIKFLRDQPAM